MTACIGSSLMTLLIIALSIAMVHIFRKARFRFIMILVSLMICSDASLGILATGFYFEGHLEDSSYINLLAVILGFFTFLFNFSNLSMHWLFSMKYWMVAHEVPKLFELGRDITFNEKTYKIINILGLVLIIPIGAITGFFRGRLSYETAGETAAGASLVQTV